MTELLNGCTLLTSEMSLSWPPRYTSIHELNKIINSPNILRLSSVVLASLQELDSCSQDLCCNKFYIQSLTVQTQDSMCTVPGIRMTCTNLISEVNGWETTQGNKLDFDSSSAIDPWPFFADTFPRDIGPRWFQGRSRDQLFWSDTVSWCRDESRLGQLSFIFDFFTEKIVWGFTGVTGRWRQHEKNYLIFRESAL